MKSRAVIVEVSGRQRLFGGQEREADFGLPADLLDFSEEDCTELTVPGIYSRQNGRHFVIYDEDDGEGNVTRNIVKLYSDYFEVTKKGASRAHMVFRAGERAESRYDTPFGSFFSAFCVKEVKLSVKEGEPAGEKDIFLKAEASYLLELNGEPTSWCQVSIRVKEAPAEAGRS